MKIIKVLLFILFTTGVTFTLFKDNNVHAQTSGNGSTFETRKQAWLNRDGQTPTNKWDGSNPHAGKGYIFAWLEKEKFINSGPSGSGLGSLSEEINELFEGVGDDIPTSSGSDHESSLYRIYYQYKDKVLSLLSDGSTIINQMESLFSTNAKHGSKWEFRRKNQSTQPIYQPLSFLWTQENDTNVTIECKGTAIADTSFTSSYSGIHYNCGDGGGPLTGGFYKTYELSRDWMLDWYDTWADKGANEYDGNYTRHILTSGALLYDFADRPGVPQPDGDVMKQRTKMIMDLTLLDMGLDFSARHHGGAKGRERSRTLIPGAKAFPFSSLFDLPFKSHGYGYHDAAIFPSTYRTPSVIEDMVELDDEPANYWHINMEDNLASTEGRWTYVTPYFNLGGGHGGGTQIGRDWNLNIRSDDGSGAAEGQPFRLWIDKSSTTGDEDTAPEYMELGNQSMYQYRNAAFFKGVGDHLHVSKGSYTFDQGENNLIDFGSGNINDYTIGSGWKFFLEKDTAIALRRYSSGVWGMEVAVIKSSASGDHVYPSFQAFQDAVNNNASLSGSSFTTSRGYTITAGGNLGLVDGKEIFDNFPFKRIETVDWQGNQLVSWNDSGAIGTMTVKKGGKTCTYNFNNWTYSGSCGGTSGPPVSPPPTNTPGPTITPKPSSTPTPNPGDTDSDGDVDIFDYNNLVSDFGQSNSPADFNDSGVVDIFDYNTLVSNFGQTT